MSNSNEPLEMGPTQEGVVIGWWRALEEDRAGRAELRRCASPSAVAFVPAYHRLLARTKQAGLRADHEALALLAGVLAHVERTSDERSFARALASGTGRPAVSGLRFRRLLRIEGPAELMTALVRVVRQLDRTAPVGALCRDTLHWNDKTRKRWAREYYETAPSEP